MSALNPYEGFLDSRPVEVILADTPRALSGLLQTMGAENSTVAPAPGKWSPAEILSHLADCELVFAYRLRQTLAEDGHVIQPFDQDKWAQNYAGISAAEALAVFSAMREWNLRLIKTVMPGAAGKVVTHPERGRMTFQTIVETMAGHDLNHLGQLKRIANA